MMTAVYMANFPWLGNQRKLLTISERKLSTGKIGICYLSIFKDFLISAKDY